MNKKILIVFVFGIHFILNGQTNNIFESLPFENINLLTDRDLYLSGETIWFNAEVRLNTNQEPLSKIIYIELFNANQRSIISKKYRITDGQTFGSIDIPAEFISDVYFLRAYTHYNKNFSADYYFMSAIQVINPRVGLPDIVTKKELGDSLSLNPYRIEENISVKDRQIVSVYKSEALEKTTELITLEVLNNQMQLISVAEFSISNKPINIAIPNSVFSNSGLYYYMLKDENDSIIKVKALIYKGISNSIPKLELKGNKFAKRELITIDLKETEGISLGIKVVQKGTILPIAEKLDLYFNNPILLISYLKNQFDPFDLQPNELSVFLKKLNAKLDANLFTKLFYPPKANKLVWNPEIRDIGLSGIAVEKQTQNPVANIPIYLSVFKDHPQIHISTTLANGSFQFSLNNLENSQDIFLCPLLDTLDNLEIKINADFSINFPKLNSIPLTIDSSNTKLIEDMFLAFQASKAFNTSNKNRINSKGHLPFSFDNPEIVISLDDYVETPTLEMIFNEIVPNVRVKKKKNYFSLPIIDEERLISYNTPLILVDNIPIFDVEELLKISPKLIEKIEVHKTPFIIGDHTIEGIIMISTLTDNFGGMIMPKSSTFLEYQMVSPSFTFNEIKYNTNEELNSRAGDFRTLLYWNPLIQGNKKQQVNFYSSNLSGDYEVYIFGKYATGQFFQTKLDDFVVIN